MEWFAIRPFLSSVIVLVVIVIPGFFRLESVDSDQEDLLVCVSEWGDEITDRSDKLSTLNMERTEALDQLIRTVAQEDSELFREQLLSYIEASDTYLIAIEENPIPESPEIQCQ